MPNRIYKAQWPLVGDQILVFPEDNPKEKYYLPVDETAKQRMFHGKFFKVYFLGNVEKIDLPNGIKAAVVDVAQFVKHKDWV